MEFLECRCFANPFASKCGQWDAMQSVCVCADLGCEASEGRPAPP